MPLVLNPAPWHPSCSSDLSYHPPTYTDGDPQAPPSRVSAKLIRRPDLVLWLFEPTCGRLYLSRLLSCVCLGCWDLPLSIRGLAAATGKRRKERMEDGEGDRKG